MEASKDQVVLSDSITVSQKKIELLYKERAFDSCIIQSDNLIKKYQRRLMYQPLAMVFHVKAKACRRLRKFDEGIIASKASMHWAKKTNQEDIFAILLLEVARNRKGLKQYGKAIETYQSAIDYSQKYGDFVSESIALNNMGAIYKIQGKFTKAIQLYIKDAELNNKLNRPKDLAIAYNNIGQIHLLTREHELAKSFFTRSKNLRLELNDEYGLALVSNNLGAVFHELKEYDKALDQFYVALATFEKYNSKYRIGEVYLNISDILLLQEKYADAIAFSKKGATFFQEVKAEGGINRALRIQGEAYLNLKNYATSLRVLRKALSYYESEEHFTAEKRNIYKLLVTVYAAQNNYQKAFEYQSKLQIIEINFTKEANKRDLAVIHEKYNNKDQLLKIDKLQKEKERKEEAIRHQKQLNFSFALVIVVLSAFGLYILINNKKLRKAHFKIRKQNNAINEIHNELTDSLQYASTIQESLNSIPEEIKNFIHDYFILLKPAQEVSGDVYNVSVVDHKIVISMMDFAGHGVPAALLATLGVKTLNQIIQSGITAPDRILTELDAIMTKIFDQNEDMVGIDMAVVTIDMKKRTLEYSGARRPLLYIEYGESHYIKGTKRSVCDSLSPFQYTFHKHIIPLTEDFRFYLYSDGFPDQFGGPKGKKFLEKNLRDLLIDNAEKDYALQKEIIQNKRDLWMNPDVMTENKPTDDTLVMGFHIKI
ncbi:tetratricopeptide repeat protein [Flammeovirga aprica]|uniref:Tetratricopeptide repeat protein n=1 Tax=Flammeovirga aprica JL-4 TaxID=694437 RepID=A0A7X9RQ62_9BACT|nr:tetratricopeptide repeat protein [Flammeovirga aprica]NME66438.1 tetratricopeptide repeat protein [Flammeovirga aprica JL-4]